MTYKEEDIQLSSIWECNDKPGNESPVAYCYKIYVPKLSSEPFIVYFNKEVELITWDKISHAKESMELGFAMR